MIKSITATVLPLVVDVPEGSITADSPTTTLVVGVTTPTISATTSNDTYDVTLTGYGIPYESAGGFKYAEESAAASETFDIAVQSATNEQVSTSETISSDVSTVTSDAAAGSDIVTLVADFNSSALDSATAVDLLSTTVATLQLETLAASETITIIMDYAWTVSDSVITADVLTAGGSFDPLYNEAGVFSEILSMDVAPVFADVSTSVDLLTTDTTKVNTDVATGSETLTISMQDYVDSDYFQSDYLGVSYTF